MIAVCSIGDCEILILRRGPDGNLQPVFHTEMQRIDGNAQSPLQLARVDDSVDPDFDPSIAIEVIERGSAVHCVSAFEGDIVILGSDGVFDNLFIDEILTICEEMISTPGFGGKSRLVDRKRLGAIARRIVAESHAKTQAGPSGWRASPIGPGGKIDDTSCVVAQVVEWTESHGEAWAQIRTQRRWRNLFSCGGVLPTCEDEVIISDAEEDRPGVARRNYPSKPNANSFSTYWGSFSEYSPTQEGAKRGAEARRLRTESGCQIM
jgi:serine/threonine protein phosphatase PrpC